MLTNLIKKRIELPNEPGQWIEIRRPSIAIYQEFSASDFNTLVLLQHCVTSWSYEAECTAENIAELDPETAGILANEIVWKDTEEDQKKVKGAPRRARG